MAFLRRSLVPLIAAVSIGFQAHQPSADQVKAVFLFNFAQFVTWPESAFAEPHAPLVIGVLGADPFGTYLDETVRDERVRGHPLAVRRFENVEDVKGCQILFVSRSEFGHLGEVLGSLKGKPILTVADAADFVQRGGMIRFVFESNRIRLKINPAAAEAVGLTISSKLLHVADVVTPGRL